MPILPLRLEADPIRREAIAAVEELMKKLQITIAWVGEVALCAWLGESVERGAIDLMALVGPDRKGHVPMMASNRGFLVDREEVEAADELDLIPIGFRNGGEVVRIHILVVSNALYASFVNNAVDATVGDVPIRVASAEDIALMLIVGDKEDSEAQVQRVIAVAGELFDRERFNARLVSIGLRKKVLA